MRVLDSAKQRLAALRQRRRVVDHLVLAAEHYTAVNGNALAAAVTFFAFLSFFPILALSFAVFGQLTKVYGGDARATLVQAANQVLPGLVGPPNGIDVDTLQSAAPGIFSVGIVLTLYSGLRWLSGMREALAIVFEKPEEDRLGFAAGKLRDVVALTAIGTVLIISVAVSGVATKVLEPLLEVLGLESVSTLGVAIVAVLLGLAANTVLFFAFFRLLAASQLPTRSLWSGALLGAGAFELLKQVSTYLLALTKESDAFQAFGIALILLVWINYFSRVVVFSAAWARTTVASRAVRSAEQSADRTRCPRRGDGPVAVAPRAVHRSPTTKDPRAAFAAGAAAMLGLVALVRRRRP